MIDGGYLKKCLEEFQIPCTNEEIEQFDHYAELLVEWNEKINLTAIVEPREIVEKHFVDSLLLLKAVALPENAKVIDVGTGAGFPGIPIAIMRKDTSVTLLDSLNKRINFLREVATKIGQQMDFVHGRAEEIGQKKEYRENFELSTARAVAHLRELAEYCLPFVKVGGYFVALKGFEIEQELEEAKFAIGEMGGQIEQVLKFELPGDNKRGIVVIRKVRQTPAKYPRISGKIKKNPLNG